MTTDLPIHHVMDSGSKGYSVMETFFGDNGDTISSHKRQYVLMVSDIDGPNTAYLDDIFPGETTYETNITRYQATVNDITNQLSRLYRVARSQIPDPVAIVAKDWKQSPSGTSWDFWRRGVNWIQHANRMLKPVRWEDMYVVGSSYCSGVCQLYAEGALQTVEMLMKWFPL